MNIFTWMNDQLVRIQWLSDLVTAGVQAVGLDPASIFSWPIALA